MDGLLLDALYAKYHAEKADAVARFNIYLKKSVGIGEHSKVLQEINDWTCKLSEAEENLDSLKKYFEDDGYVRDEPKKQLLSD